MKTSTKADQFASLLRQLAACSEARLWAKGKTLTEVWQTCECGDWMLWLAARLVGKHKGVTHQQVVLAACSCAETALHLVPAGEDRPRVAIETARRWAKGDPAVSLDNVRAAAAAADAAYAHAAAYAYAYAYAAVAAAYAYSAAYSAAYAAARTAALRECAHIVRKYFRVKITEQERVL